MFDNLFKTSAPAKTPASGGSFSNLFPKTSAQPTSVLSQINSAKPSPNPQANLTPEIPATALAGQGGGYGSSNETDSSGQPLLTFLNPAAKSSQLLSDRVAPKGDPTKAVKNPITTTPRMAQSSSDAIRKTIGLGTGTELDHIQPLEGGGSNNKSNLRPESAVDPSKPYSGSNQTATDPLENALRAKVNAGQISEAQMWQEIAKAKGITLPEQGGKVPQENQIQPNLGGNAPAPSTLDKVGGFFGGLFNKAKDAAGNAVQTVKDAGLSYLAGEPISTKSQGGANSLTFNASPDAISALTTGKNAPVQPDSPANKLSFLTDLPKNIAQGATRSALGFGKTLLGQDETSQPGEINGSKLSPIEQIATYGKEPVGPLVDSATVAAAKQGQPKALGGLGLAGLGLGANVTLDPGTWGDDALAKLAKETDTEKIISILTAKGVEHEGASSIAPILSQAQTPEQVKAILQTVAQKGIIMNGAEKTGTTAADEFAAQQAGKTAKEVTKPNLPTSEMPITPETKISTPQIQEMNTKLQQSLQTRFPDANNNSETLLGKTPQTPTQIYGHLMSSAEVRSPKARLPMQDQFKAADEIAKEIGLDTSIVNKSALQFIKEGGGYLTDKTDIGALRSKIGDFSVVVKDVNGNRAMIPSSIYEKLTQNKGFTDRIRSVFINPTSVGTNEATADPEFMSQIFKKGETLKLAGESGAEMPKPNVSKLIGKVNFTGNSTGSKTQISKFINTISDERIQNLLLDNDIKNVNVEAPHKFGLSEQGNISPSTKTINISADATDPSHTMLHELGHAKFESLPIEQQNTLIQRAKDYNDPAMAGYKKLGEWKEIIADSLYTRPDFAPEFYATNSETIGSFLEKNKAKVPKLRTPVDNSVKESFLARMQKEANPTEFEKGGAEKAPEVNLDEQSLAEAGAKTVGGNGTKVGGLDKDTRKIYQDWANYRGQSNKAISGRMAAEPFESLRKSGMDAVHAFQAGDRSGQLEAVDKWGKTLLAKEQEAGIPVESRANYLPQYWANSESEIQKAREQFINDNPGKRVSLTPGFSREATFPDYKTGEEYGLTPKYNNIPDMINARVRASEQALADRALFDNMAKHNLVVPSSQAPQGWKTLNPDKFPRFPINAGGKVFHGTVSAPAPLADLINAQLRGTESQTDRIFLGTAKWATKLKTIVLGSGIPGTAIQFHAFNELAATVPELFNQPTLFTSALQYMFHPNSAEGFIDANLPMAQEAARSGLVLGGEEIALDSLAQKAVNQGLKGTVSGLFKKGEDVLYKVFAKNTFEKMVPALKIKMWADTKEFLMDKGMSEADAAKNAADRANQTFGGLNYAALGRDPNLQNMIRTFVFAPDFWESRFKYAGNMAKGLVGKGSMAKLYRNAALTVLGAYVAMNIANKKTSGKWMFQNPAGHSMDIYGGTDSKGKNIWVRPFGTDLDFARLPMDLAQSIIQTGDLSGIATDARNRVSTLLQPILTLVSNSDAFGNPVFQPANTAHPLWGQIAMFASTLPVVPQVGVGIAGLFTPGTSKEEAISKAAGLPVKFNSATTPTTSSLADMIYTERPTLESQIKKDYLAGNEQDAYNKMAEFNKNLLDMTIKAYEDNGHSITDRTAFVQYLATHTQAQGGLKGLFVMPPTQKVLDNATKKQGQPLFNKIFPSNITTP